MSLDMVPNEPPVFSAEILVFASPSMFGSIISRGFNQACEAVLSYCGSD